MCLFEKVKGMMNGINKIQLLRESQGRRVKDDVTGGDRAYLEGKDGGHAGVFLQALGFKIWTL